MLTFRQARILRPPLRQAAHRAVCTSIHQLPGSCTAWGALSPVPAALTVLLRPSYMPPGLPLDLHARLPTALWLLLCRC